MEREPPGVATGAPTEAVPAAQGAMTLAPPAAETVTEAPPPPLLESPRPPLGPLLAEQHELAPVTMALSTAVGDRRLPPTAIGLPPAAGTRRLAAVTAETAEAARAPVGLKVAEGGVVAMAVEAIVGAAKPTILGLNDLVAIGELLANCRPCDGG